MSTSTCARAHAGQKGKRSGRKPWADWVRSSHASAGCNYRGSTHRGQGRSARSSGHCPRVPAWAARACRRTTTHVQYERRAVGLLNEQVVGKDVGPAGPPAHVGAQHAHAGQDRRVEDEATQIRLAGGQVNGRPSAWRRRSRSARSAGGKERGEGAERRGGHGKEEGRGGVKGDDDGREAEGRGAGVGTSFLVDQGPSLLKRWQNAGSGSGGVNLTHGCWRLLTAPAAVSEASGLAAVCKGAGGVRGERLRGERCEAPRAHPQTGRTV